MNRAAEAISGWSRQELVRQSVAKMLTPASFALGQERVRRSLAGERLPKLFELEALRKDGTVVPLEGWARFILDRRNRPTAHLGVYRDVSERRQAEAALRESEERYRKLFENANDPIATLSLEGITLSVNRALERSFGYSSSSDPTTRSSSPPPPTPSGWSAPAGWSPARSSRTSPRSRSCGATA